MKFLLVLATSGFMHFLLWAQNSSTPEVTIPLLTSNVQIVPADTLGFLVLDLSGPQINPNQLALVVHSYYPSLRQRWKNTLPVSRGLLLQYFQVENSQLFLVFQDNRQQVLELFSVALETGQFQRSQFGFSNTFQLENLVSWNQYLLASGSMSGQGMVFSLDRQKNQYQILPTAYAQRVSGIREMYVDPVQNQLGFYLRTEVNKSQTYVLRTLDLTTNRVINDQVLEPPKGFQLAQIKRVPLGGKAYIIIGVYFKRDPTKSEGLYLGGVDKEGELAEQYYTFKDIPGFTEFVYWTDSDSERKSRSQKGDVNVLLDQLELQGGGMVIALELLEKNYKTKGALQQEFERSQMVNSLDQDQFGRRSFDQTAEGQTAEDRIEKRSATDILQYRYRNAIVAQPTYQGLAYDRTVLLTLDQNLKLAECRGLKTGKLDFTYLGTPNTFTTDDGIRQFYDRGGSLYTWLYKPDNHQFVDLQTIKYSKAPSRAMRIAHDQFLVVELLRESAGYLLKLRTQSF